MRLDMMEQAGWSTDPDFTRRREVARFGDTSPACLAAMAAAEPDDHVASYVAMNSATPVEAIRVLDERFPGNIRVAQGLAVNPNTPSSIRAAAIVKVVEDTNGPRYGNSGTLPAVARSRGLSVADVVVLCTAYGADGYGGVASDLATNPWLPEAGYAVLPRTRHVAGGIATNSNAPAGELRWAYIAGAKNAVANPRAPIDLMEHAAAESESAARGYLATNPVVPLHLLGALRTDPEAWVRRAAWSNARTDTFECRRYLANREGWDEITILGVLGNPLLSVRDIDEWARDMAQHLPLTPVEDGGQHPLGWLGDREAFYPPGPAEDIGRRFSAMGWVEVESAILQKIADQPNSSRSWEARERLKVRLAGLKAAGRFWNRMI